MGREWEGGGTFAWHGVRLGYGLIIRPLVCEGATHPQALQPTENRSIVELCNEVTMDERIKKPNCKQLVGAPNVLSYVLNLKVPTVPKKQYQSGVDGWPNTSQNHKALGEISYVYLLAGTLHAWIFLLWTRQWDIIPAPVPLDLLMFAFMITFILHKYIHNVFQELALIWRVPAGYHKKYI
jgi:hypothetical protein